MSPLGRPLGEDHAAPHVAPGSAEPRLALTPAGVLHAFADAQPGEDCQALQSILSQATLPLEADWLQRADNRAELLALGLDRGWLQRVSRELPAPDVRLDEFLSHVIRGLSGEHKVALSSTGGFCIGHTGFELAQAEVLCAAAADHAEFMQRQRVRGWAVTSNMVSFHDDAAMLMPSTSFIPFWVDGVDYCLVIAGEPLINNPAFVELVWGIQVAGTRFGKLG